MDFFFFQFAIILCTVFFLYFKKISLVIDKRDSKSEIKNKTHNDIFTQGLYMGEPT